LDLPAIILLPDHCYGTARLRRQLIRGVSNHYTPGTDADPNGDRHCDGIVLLYWNHDHGYNIDGYISMGLVGSQVE